MSANGNRFYCSPDKKACAWLHPLEQPTNRPDWIDVTELNDEQFEAFILGDAEAKQQELFR